MQFNFASLVLPGPEGRANAIRSSLIQVQVLTGDRVHPDALRCAFERLAVARTDDTLPITARRATCLDIARAMLDSRGPVQVDHLLAEPWFQAQIDAWTDSEDPRQRAMADTARRELAELRRPSPIEAVLTTHPGPHTDCSFDGGGRYPRNDEGWDARPCAYLFLDRHRVSFDEPRSRGEAVLEAEASGRVFFNDTPQVVGRLREPVAGPEWKSRVFAARLPSGEPHALAWWWDGVTHTAVPHDQVVWG